MEGGDSSFPLYQLPTAPLKCVLQNMEFYHQMSFSILSKRSKELIKSLTLEVRSITVIIGRQVSIEVYRPHELRTSLVFYTKKSLADLNAGNHILFTEMYTPEVIVVLHVETPRQGHDAYKWNTFGYEIKYWIDHILSIFNRSKADKLCLTRRDPFDVKSLQPTISDVTEIRTDNHYPAAYIQLIVQAFPSTRELNLSFDTLENLKDYHSTFCQNFDVLSFQSMGRNGLKLYDLMVMNSWSIRIEYSNFTEKDFNVFLKHWINGSNPRMNHFAINFPDIQNPNKEIILKGLNHQIVPSEHERLLKRPIEDYFGDRTDIVRGGYDINRKDGTTATIVFHQYHQHRTYHLEVFVWH